MKKNISAKICAIGHASGPKIGNRQDQHMHGSLILTQFKKSVAEERDILDLTICSVVEQITAPIAGAALLNDLSLYTIMILFHFHCFFITGILIVHSYN